MPKVSVIIPTYNRAKYICEAIESVLSQTFKDLEIIVIDDGSKDNTNDILTKYNGSIRYFYQENRGISAARNKGIEEARGEYIAFLDSDDTWLPRKLAKQLEVFESDKKMGLVGSLMNTIDSEGKSLGVLKPKNPVGNTFETVLITGGPPPSTYIIRKECFDTVGLFDDGLKMFEDADLLLRISRKYSIITINEALGNYRIHSSNMTNEDYRIYPNSSIINRKWLPYCETKETKKVIMERIKKYSLLLAKYNFKNLRLPSFLKYFSTYLKYLIKSYCYDNICNKKYLLLTNDFLPHKGGSRIYYYNVYKRFEKDRVVILTHKTDGYKEFDKDQTYRIYRINLNYKRIKNEKIRESIVYGKLLFFTVYLLFKENISVIHCGEVLPTGFIGYLCKFFFKIPYLVYVHGEEMTILPKQAKNEYKLAVMVLKYANKIIAACSFVEDKIKSVGIPENKIIKILPGVDEVFLTDNGKQRIESPKVKLGLGKDKIILTVGRLVERKGQEMVIRALPSVLNAIPDAKYLIIGKGPAENNLRKLAIGLNVNQYVKFIGEVQENEIVDYYSLCDVFVMPNRALDNGDTEGFGMVFLEANALGKPVIGGNTGGTMDSIINGVTGFRVNSEDIGEIADRIIYLLSNPLDAQKIGEAGRKRVIDSFLWEQRSNRLKNLSLD